MPCRSTMRSSTRLASPASSRITHHVRAVFAQNLELVSHLLGRPVAMPHVGVSRGRAKRPLLAPAADQDGQSLLHRPHEYLGVDELVVGTGVRDSLAVDELA